MHELSGDIFELVPRLRLSGLVITTNGSIRNDGCAVMGRGVALEAKKRWAGIDAILGAHLKADGNHVHELSEPHVYPWQTELGYRIYSFPVKHRWMDAKADIALIRRSLVELRLAVPPEETVALVRPGCGNGGLSWEEVRPLVEEALPGVRFVVVER